MTNKIVNTQFSSTAGLAEIEEPLKANINALCDIRIEDASNWLGNDILILCNIATPGANGKYSGEFHLDAESSNLTIDFLNDRGEIVQAIELGNQESGPITFQWNALDAGGHPLSHGELRVRVNGGAISDLSTWATVEAVQSPADATQAKLITPRGEFSLAEAIRLS